MSTSKEVEVRFTQSLEAYKERIVLHDLGGALVLQRQIAELVCGHAELFIAALHAFNEPLASGTVPWEEERRA